MSEPGKAIRRSSNWWRNPPARSTTIFPRTSAHIPKSSSTARPGNRCIPDVFRLIRRYQMTRKLVVPFFVMTLGLLTIGTPVFAHHGTAGVYDFTHRITTKATVTEYIWANPHVQIYFKLKNDKGEEQTW